MSQCLNLLLLLLAVSESRSYDAIFDAGGIYVDAMLTVYGTENGECGEIEEESVQSIEAMKWTYSRLNAINYTPGVQLGLRFHRTCRSAARAVWIAYELSREQSQDHPNHTVMGVLGPSYSSEAEVVSEMFSALPTSLQMLQISFSATSSVLADKTKYKNFFRTIPPDNVQIKAMYKFMRTLNWTYVSIFYDDDTYGQGGVSGLQMLATQGDICFPEMFPIDPDLSVNETYTRSFLKLNQIMNRATPLYGIVIFGSSKLANAILDASKAILLDSNRTVSLPTFLFSEGAGFFEDRDIDTFEILKGAFVVGPPKRIIEEFNTYWQSLFLNTTLLVENSKSNPWLIDIFNKVTECVSKDPLNCPPLNQSTINEAIPQTLFTQYAVQAALVLARVIKFVHGDLCSTSGPCEKFLKASKDIFIQKMNNVDIEFDRDFFDIMAFRNPDLKVKFDGSADVVFEDGVPSYEVYNYRRCDTRQGEFCFQKVAEYFAGADVLQVQTNKIKSYTAAGEEVDIEHIRAAQCPDGHVCTECIVSTTEPLLFIPGDMYVVGVVPVHDKSDTPLKCGKIKTGGVDVVEAIRYAVNESKLKFVEDIPDADIGIIVLDSCNDPEVTQEKLILLNRYGVEVDNDFIPVKDKIVGYVGAWISDVSISVSEILQRLKYVQISYGSTAPVLSDRSKHPYFMRVTSPDTLQAKVIIEIVQELKADVIQILHVDSAYGNGGKDAVVQYAQASKICIAQIITVPRTDVKDFSAIVDKLLEHAEAKIVVLFLTSFQMENVVADLNKFPELLPIASEAWGTRDILNGFFNLKGSITVANELPTDSKFSVYMRSLRTGSSDLNPWLREYMETYFDCYFQWSFNKTAKKMCTGSDILDPFTTFKIETWVPYAENAVYALLTGAGKTLADLCGNSRTICQRYLDSPDRLIDAVKNVTLKWDLVNRKALFNSNGDGLTPYSIYTVGEEEGLLKYISVGTGGSGTLQFDVNTWERHNGGSVSSVCGGSPACKKCFGIVDEETKTTEDSSRLGLIAGIVVCIVITLGLIVVVAVLARRLITEKKKEKNDPDYNYIRPTHSFDDKNLSTDNTRTTSERYISGSSLDVLDGTSQSKTCNPDIGYFGLHEPKQIDETDLNAVEVKWD